jgi:hypothetical protein
MNNKEDTDALIVFWGMIRDEDGFLYVSYSGTSNSLGFNSCLGFGRPCVAFADSDFDFDVDQGRTRSDDFSKRLFDFASDFPSINLHSVYVSRLFASARLHTNIQLRQPRLPRSCSSPLFTVDRSLSWSVLFDLSTLGVGGKHIYHLVVTIEPFGCLSIDRDRSHNHNIRNPHMAVGLHHTCRRSGYQVGVH